LPQPPPGVVRIYDNHSYKYKHHVQYIITPKVLQQNSRINSWWCLADCKCWWTGTSDTGMQ